MIELNEEFELDWLDFSLNDPDKITALPVSLYHKFFDYLVQEGRWQDVFKITQVKGKVVHQTVDEIVSGSEVIYSSQWTREETLHQYSRLLECERELSDEEFAERVELLYECVPISYMISSVKLDLVIRRRVLNYCDERGITVDKYDGPLPYRLYKQQF